MKAKRFKYISLGHFLVHFRLLEIRSFENQMKISSSFNGNKKYIAFSDSQLSLRLRGINLKR